MNRAILISVLTVIGLVPYRVAVAGNDGYHPAHFCSGIGDQSNFRYGNDGTIYNTDAVHRQTVTCPFFTRDAAATGARRIWVVDEHPHQAVECWTSGQFSGHDRFYAPLGASLELGPSIFVQQLTGVGFVSVNAPSIDYIECELPPAYDDPFFPGPEESGVVAYWFKN
ncbi:MAG: hypothetical protein R3B40_25000 [Polyangiales bacterium]|nr:hypothetical protein [Sandaracinaceae bacterium]